MDLALLGDPSLPTSSFSNPKALLEINPCCIPLSSLLSASGMDSISDFDMPFSSTRLLKLPQVCFRL